MFKKLSQSEAFFVCDVVISSWLHLNLYVINNSLPHTQILHF